MPSGKLSVVSSRQEVTWDVQHFFQQPSSRGFFLQSPTFNFAGDCYCLQLFPNGHRGVPEFAPQFVDIELKPLSITRVRRDVSFELGFNSKTGKKIAIFRRDIFGERKVLSFAPQIFEQNRDPYFPDRPLTLILTMRLGEPSSAGCSKSEKAETPDRKEEQGLPGVIDLQSDYRQLLQKGLDSDACLVVSGREFRVHRCVLRARSEVFDAMFRHETAEQANGRVVIDDLDPDCFVHFLEYLYTGVVGAGLSDDNVFGLYVAADKYGVLTLKSECVAYMRTCTLSVDSFCDFVTLAQRHQEEDLLQRTVLFFKANLPRIVTTPKWQKLVLDNGASVIELFTKAFPPGEQ